MVSQIPDPTTLDPNRTTFEVERLAFTEPGKLFVSGRWSGVRGRRFVRPSLTLVLRSDGARRRALAELEQQPWAAEDGELWIASFAVEVEFEDLAEIELSVAPDISVELKPSQRSTPKRGQRLTVAPAPDARGPRVRTDLVGADRVRARPAAGQGAEQIERLKARLTFAERAAEHERAKRDAAVGALEGERSESLRLRAELGRLRAELDLGAAANEELSSASSELDATRTEAHATERRLEAATRAFEEQRAESERLRSELAGAQARMHRLIEAGGETAAPRGHLVTKPDSHLPRAERPLNPALRSRTNWLGRTLALLVILAVIAAIVLVIHSTLS